MTSVRESFPTGESHPFGRVVLAALALPALTDTLGLSDRQVEELSRLKDQLLEDRRAYRQGIRENREVLEELFGSGEAPKPWVVRRHLTEQSICRANCRADLYERVLEMREVLTEGQREVLAHLTPRDLRCQVRRHTSLAEEREIDRVVREVASPGLPVETPETEESPQEVSLAEKGSGSGVRPDARSIEFAAPFRG